MTAALKKKSLFNKEGEEVKQIYRKCQFTFMAASLAHWTQFGLITRINLKQLY